MRKALKLKLKTPAKPAGKAPERAQEQRKRRPATQLPPDAPARLPLASIEGLYLEGVAAGRTTEELIEANPEWGYTSASQLHLLIVDDEDFMQRYLRARRAAVIGVSESILPIVDDGKNDFMEKESEKGNTYTVSNHENIQRSRLRVDARFKLLEALDPSTFGKKIDVSNKDGSLGAQWAAALSVANTPVKKDAKK